MNDQIVNAMEIFYDGRPCGGAHCWYVRDRLDAH